MRIDPDSTLYILDAHCARRLASLLDQLRDVFAEALARRRFDPADRLDYGIEEADMVAALGNFKTGELEDHF